VTRLHSLSDVLLARVALVHFGETFQVSREPLISQSDLSHSAPPLLAALSAVRSSVPLAIFRDFVGGFKTETIEIANESFGRLSLLCAEFGFRALTAKLSGFWASLAFGSIASCPAGFESLIVWDFPRIFAEFRRKRFSLLWRGSRRGFRARNFHLRCDGHANTLTMLLDTKENLFGGFRQRKWESPTFGTRRPKNGSAWRADGSPRSFFSTLENPRNIPARKFELDADHWWWAIGCVSDWCPSFRDIRISDNCNAKTVFRGSNDRVFHPG
jgi:hypothetical protein